MNKSKKKALKKELKTLTAKQKDKLIMHLFDQNDRMSKAQYLQYEIMNSMVESKSASASGSMQ